MDKLQCNVCEGTFEVKAGDYPYNCPLCQAVFCGEDCCGVYPEYIYMDDPDGNK